MHWNSISASANVRAPRAAAHPVLNAARHGIGFDLQDVALEEVLRAAVRGRHDFYEAAPEEATLTITDRAPEENGFGAERRVLRIGVEQGGRNALDSLDPGLILSAASLIAAGYTLDRERQGETRSASGLLPHLSQRERQVADLLVDGASNKVIARALDISVHTAKFHVTAILEKLGARNRADAVSIILREGLVAI